MAYRAYGLTLESDLPLDLPNTDVDADLHIGRRGEPVDQREVVWFPPDPDGWCEAGQLNGGYYLLFETEAEFVVSDDGLSVSWFSFTDRSSTLTHLLLDHVLPRALARQGNVVLHGACLSPSPDRCYAIVGDSGQGKSTLAAALSASGHQFLADDCVVVKSGSGGPYAVAAYPELRLGAQSVELAGDTRLVDVGEVTRQGIKRRMALASNEEFPFDERHRLTNVFVLDGGEAGSSASGTNDPFGPAAATVELIAHSFHLNAATERSMAFERFASVAEVVQIRSLIYEHSAEGLASVLADVHAIVDRP